ncbi:hypothetical protein NQ317_003036 [Molorchus minor]|uniref:Yellow-e n=1 Tax=Molorchus minor TaxID=1323400 RepID=A0ABQ9JFT1_9CUCU|nr:hypothetical protein NQ317_003036 [Molorchus minor]
MKYHNKNVHITFRPENTLFTGIEVTDDRIFLALPSIRAGVPLALATIPRHTPPGSSPALQPYPDWSYQGAATNLSCSGLISVYRIKTDSCNRLWVLDAGIRTSIDSYRRVCRPKLVAFDLRSNQIVRTINFPDDVLRPNTGLINFIIDESVQGKCDSSFFYVVDTLVPGLIVVDGIKEQAWRFSDPTMFPNPDYATYNIAGDTFTLMDGIIGIAHSPQLATTYFQPLATDKIFSIPTSALIRGPPGELDELPISVAGRKSSQGLALALNPQDNTLFFSPFAETSVASWNVQTNEQRRKSSQGLALTLNPQDNTLFFSPFAETSVASWNVQTDEQRILAYDPNSLQFTSELRLKDGSLWAISSRFHKFFKRTVTPSEVNLRVMRIQLDPPTVSNHLSNRFYF